MSAISDVLAVLAVADKELDRLHNELENPNRPCPGCNRWVEDYNKLSQLKNRLVEENAKLRKQVQK